VEGWYSRAGFMPESSPSGDPSGSPSSTGATRSRASGELVPEQTVRAPNPLAAASETTVKSAFPMQPPQEQTVRAFVPSALAGATAHANELEELEELDVEPVIETLDPPMIDVGALVSDLEAHVRTATHEGDAPVARAEQVTVPEAAAKLSELLESDKRGLRARGKRERNEGPSLRTEPPAVSGEVSVGEPDPGSLFGPSPRREEQVRARRGAKPRRDDPAKPRRDDPPLVSGEVAIDSSAAQSPEVPAGDVFVLAMTASGPQPRMASSGSHPIMTASGPQAMMASSGSHPIMLASGPQSAMTSSGSHPIMTASGASPVMTASGASPIMTASGASPVMTASGASHVVPRRSSTDPGYAGGENTGPQPRGQGDPTGPHPVMRIRRRRGESPRDSMVLWVLAGTLVVLAMGVVMMVISWAR
jgi:hypothetical protein